MRICIPVAQDRGIDSTAYGHFGSAPSFIIHDTGTGETVSVSNANVHHKHGTCSPMEAIGKHAVDAVVVGGIGRRALEGLNAMGVRVYLSPGGTVRHIVDALLRGAVQECKPEDACGGHGGGHGH
ncbi:MAG: NifB/NifX family molybdenum-iron cluster-binding protein [Bacteroidota bacterium]|nr:NifB/NifX family molybdenum-iron cluster-binding protein [Bacteroidota bacterium]